MAKKAKTRTEDAFTALQRLGAAGDVFIEKPASPRAIQVMQRDAKRDLNMSVPEAYAAFLKITNGVQIENSYFKEAENLVAENLDLAYPDVMVLGTDGNMAYYVFDHRDGRFHTVNLGDPNDPSQRFESYETFEQMLLGVMKEQGVL